ncbi:MAG TPA: DHH family phosphoesterase [Candidatus Methanoperedens sp.]|nr:DHH family phosphoesterase [Candidatus Methanoperedens sp.]
MSEERPPGRPPAADDPLAGLLRAAAGSPGVVICTHRNPDPDSISSALALRYLLEHAGGIRATVANEGMIGRAENRALVSLLRLPLRPLASLPALDWGQVALVDTQPRSGNNSFPRNARPLAVIDHHPPLKTTAAAWVDIRPGYGATATILTEYLERSGLAVPAWLATALAYGISSETRDLGRGAGERDMAAYLWLYPKVRRRILARIEHPRLPRSYFAVLDRALHRAVSYRNVIGSRLGEVESPDSVAEIADFLLAHERMGWSIATGRHRGQLHVSLRAIRGRGAGRLLREMLRERGTAGGHGRMAGGQIDLAGLTPFEAEALEEELLARLLNLLGFHGRAEFRPLLARPDEAAGGLALDQSAGVASPGKEGRPEPPAGEIVNGAQHHD